MIRNQQWSVRAHSILLAAGMVLTYPAMAQQAEPPPGNPPPDNTRPPPNELLLDADRAQGDSQTSPVRRINRDTPPPDEANVNVNEFRSIEGVNNNLNDTAMGATLIWLTRWVPADYGDGLSTLAGTDRPSAREISNIVNAQSESLPNDHGTTDFLWQWGQFLDHDMDLTDGADPAEPEPISVPSGDPWFDPDAEGNLVINFNRSLSDPDTGLDAQTPRQQINEITAWIDASNVYGSDIERATALRRMDGSGTLRTSDGGLLPFNTEGLANAGGDSDRLFLAGDVRANEQLGLTAMHTLFVREHNRLARQIAADNPQLDGDAVYQRARKLVGAEMQIITFREYIPALLGRDAFGPYEDYDPEVDASISNVFATASYRYGHSALSPTILRIDAQGREIEAGHLALRNAFFAPSRLTDEGGIAPLLRGLAAQPHQAIDPFVIDDVRNFLFGPPGAGGFDLAALNIQRGRDHGLPSYNDLREHFGLERLGPEQFGRISSQAGVEQRLRDAYPDVDAIDAWVGGLAEDTLPGAQVGPLIHAVLSRQFMALRDGDRFWWERTLTPAERDIVAELRLSDIIRLNTRIGDELQNDVFHLPNTRGAGPGPGQGGNGGGNPPPG